MLWHKYYLSRIRNMASKGCLPHKKIYKMGLFFLLLKVHELATYI